MSSESVCQVARSWVDVGSFYACLSCKVYDFYSVIPEYFGYSRVCYRLHFLWLVGRFFYQAVSSGNWANHGSWYRHQIFSWDCIWTHWNRQTSSIKGTFPQYVTSHGLHNENIYRSWGCVTSHCQHIFIFRLSILYRTQNVSCIMCNVESWKT
jgi:hypothetical protein